MRQPRFAAEVVKFEFFIRELVDAMGIRDAMVQ